MSLFSIFDTEIRNMEQLNPQIDYLPGSNPAKYLTSNKVQRLVELRERVFFLKDTGVTPRLFNVWKVQGLIDQPLNPDQRTWVKLGFCEYIWVRMIDDLRSFGCSVNDIKKVKAICLKDLLDAGREALSEDYVRKVLIDSIEKGDLLSGEEKKGYLKIIEESKVPILKLIKEEAGIRFTNLEMMILNLLITGSDASLILALNPNEDGNTDKVLVKLRSKRKSRVWAFFYTDEYRKMNFPVDPEMILSLPHIKLPLASYVADFIVNPENDERTESLRLLSKEELTLLREMRKGGIRKLTIFFAKDKINRLDITRPMQRVQQARLAETFLKNEFADIEYTVESGQIVKFQKTTKIKMT